MIMNYPHIAQRRHGVTSTRKRSRRFLLAATFLSVLLIGTSADSVGAYRGWCRADPQFLIGGELVLVTVHVQVRDLSIARELSTGPIKIVLTVPSGTRAKYLASNDGFGYGYDVVIEHSHELKLTDQVIPVHVEVLVPMSDSTVPVRVTFIPAGSADQSLVGEKTGRSADRGRDNGVLTAGTATGTANDWIELTT